MALFPVALAEIIAHVAKFYPQTAPFLEPVVKAVMLWLLVTGAYEGVAKPAMKALSTSRRGLAKSAQPC